MCFLNGGIYVLNGDGMKLKVRSKGFKFDYAEVWPMFVVILAELLL